MSVNDKIYFVLASLEDALAKQYDAKLLARIKEDSSAKFTTSKELVDHIVSFDPTGKSYKRWLVVTYLNKGIAKVEDLYKAKQALAIFEKYKTKISNKDINSYKTLQGLFKVTDPLDINSKNVDKDSVSDKDTEALFYKKKQAILIHNSTKFKIVQPKTKEASQFFGRNTKWCTAADDENNAFNDYKKSYNLFYILDKVNNKRWAIVSPKNHDDDTETEAFDERDNSISPMYVLDIDSEIKNALSSALNYRFLYRNNIPVTGKNKKLLDEALENTHRKIKKGNYTNIKYDVISRQDLDSVVELVMKGKIKNNDTINGLCHNKALSLSNIQRLMTKNLSVLAKKGLASNINVDYNILKKLVSTGNKDIQIAVARNIKADTNILQLLIKSGYNDVITNVLKNPNTPLSILEKYLKSSNTDDDQIESILYNPRIPYDLVKKYFVKDGHNGIFVLIEHPDFKQIDLKPAIYRLPLNTRRDLASGPHYESIIEILLKDKDEFTRENVAEHVANNGESKFFDTVLKDKSEKVRMKMLDADFSDLSDSVKQDIMIRLLNDPSDKIKIHLLEDEFYYEHIPILDLERLYQQSKNNYIKEACLMRTEFKNKNKNIISCFQRETDVKMLSFILSYDEFKIPADTIIEKLPLLMKKPSDIVSILKNASDSFNSKVINYIFENSKDETTKNVIKKLYGNYLSSKNRTITKVLPKKKVPAKKGKHK